MKNKKAVLGKFMFTIIIGFIAMFMVLTQLHSKNKRLGNTGDDSVDMFGACKIGSLLVPEKYKTVKIIDKTDEEGDKQECEEDWDEIHGLGLGDKICCASEEEVEEEVKESEEDKKKREKAFNYMRDKNNGFETKVRENGKVTFVLDGEEYPNKNKLSAPQINEIIEIEIKIERKREEAFNYLEKKGSPLESSGDNKDYILELNGEKYPEREGELTHAQIREILKEKDRKEKKIMEEKI